MSVGGPLAGWDPGGWHQVAQIETERHRGVVNLIAAPVGIGWFAAMIMAFGPAGARAMLSHPGHPVDTGPGRKPERGEFPSGAGEPRVSPASRRNVTYHLL